MKWSWKLTRVAGIDVYVHATFFILVLWLGMSYWLAGGGLAAVLNGVGFILSLFLCVVLHELGHALTARRFGIQTRHIILLPIGGVASMERMPKEPKQEILVALAGPAVNLVIAAALWLLLAAGLEHTPMRPLSVTDGPFLERLMIVNLFLAGFNLLPAFPMDGGRVLRAALALRMNHVQATRVAASVGQGLALWLGLLGLFSNPFLIFIALFVWIGAASEFGAEQMKSALAGVKVGHAMLTDFRVLGPGDTLAHGVEATLAGSQQDFPVMADGAVIGVLTQADLLKGLREHGEQGRVSEVMHREVESGDVNEPLEEVLERLQHCACRLLIVTEAGKVVGIVNLDNIMELLNFHEALEGRKKF